MTNTLMIVLCSLCIVASGCSKSQTPDSATAQKPDSVVLRGIWSGHQIGDKTPGDALLIVGDGKLEFHDANTNIWYKATFSLHEDTVPKQTDILIADCFDRVYIGNKAHAIYKVADGTLTFTINPPGNPAMPASFDDHEATRYVFMRKQ